MQMTRREMTNAQTDLTFADLSEGDEYYVSDWFTLDEEHLRAFSYSTYLDPEHVDLTISKNNPFGSDLVDGFWMVSMLLYFNFKYGRRGSEREYGFNYGLDGVRFTAPLMLGERIRVRSVIDKLKPHPQGILVSTRNTMEIEGKEKPCMVATLHLLRITPEE
jgi:acyl dehydratase